MYYNEKHAKVVEQRGDNYQYIGSYKKGDILNNGNVAKRGYMRVKCPYCGTEYDVSRNGFGRGNKCSYCCHEYKNSFAYHIEMELNLKLEDVWDFKKNTLNPYYIECGSHKKVWFKCIKNSNHPSYESEIRVFKRGYRCPYCAHKKIIREESLGYNYPELIPFWGTKNKKSIFEISCFSSSKCWFICENCNKEYQTLPKQLTKYSRSKNCLNCGSSKGENKILEHLKYKNIKYITQKTFDSLVGVNDGLLSYDFYLPDYNLLIEYQGEFHDGNTRFKKDTYYNRQQEHDKRKREYAKNHNIKLLEIWYWDYDNIEEILNKELDLH